MAVTRTSRAPGKTCKRCKPRPATLTVISSKEIERMRKGGPSAYELQTAEHKASLRREAELAATKELRKKEDKVKAELAWLEATGGSAQRRVAEDAAVRANALRLLEEQRDEVKRMNQMLLYSKCAAIRDQQIEEKKQHRISAAEREKAVHADIERRRLRQMAIDEEREKVSFERRRAGMAVLEDQLEEHEQQREHADQLKREEQERLNKAIELANEQDAAAAAKRRAAGAALLREIMAGNASMIARKRAERAAEAEDDRRVLAYARARDAKAQAAQEEKVRAAKAKELETAKLRAAQQKAMDTRMQLDELRARRWQESAASRERQEAFRAAEKAAAAQATLAAARHAQAAARTVARAEAARAEAADFARTLRHVRAEQAQIAAQSVDRMQEAAEAVAKRAHLSQLQQQVEEKTQARLAARAAAAAEGDVIKERLRKERAEIETIRQKKLQQMADEGIPEKYRSQLAREKFAADLPQ